MSHSRQGMQALLLLTAVALSLGARASNAARQPAQVATALSLAGDWKYLPFDGTTNFADPSVPDADWPAMRLPSNWFLKGSAHYPAAIDLLPVSPGVIVNPGDLAAAGPERGLDYSGSVWFRRHFQHAPAGITILRFEMVDYFADVYVNGHFAGHHEGSFQPFEFDVSRWLVPGDNVVAVKVSAPAQVIDWTEEYAASWPRRQTQVKGVFAYHDTRPGGTSGRGQARGTGGIVGDVTLRQSSGVDVVRAEIAPLDVTADRATLRIDYVLRNWTAGERTATLTGEIAPKNFDSSRRDRFTQLLQVPPGESRVRVTRHIEQPALWWSWDYGQPNLYQLTSTLDGRPQSTTFGVRSITRDKNWVWHLNGRRIFPRGSNYISTQWLSQADRAWYERDLDLMLKANLNSIRVHAHVERPEFYELADERGLMVWQDFPLQWGYSDLPAFHAEAMRQLGDMVGLLFSHPSIIVWSMHNEAPHAMSWMKRKTPDQNLALDEALFAETTRRDPSRVAHRDSGTGDGHPYPGWYGGKAADYAALPGAPFITEYGAQAMPGPETMRAMLRADDRWPNDEKTWETWAFHNFQRDATFNSAKIPIAASRDDFIWNSQNYQSALLRFATESYRRAKWTRVTGLYQFMFVDDWPSITWSVLDYYRRPKRGYTTLAEVMQQTLPSIEYAIDDPAAPITLWVVNDRPEAFPGARLAWTMAGREHALTVDVPADGVVKAIVLGPGTAIARGGDTLAVSIAARSGRVLGTNHLAAADYLYWKQ